MSLLMSVWSCSLTTLLRARTSTTPSQPGATATPGTEHDLPVRLHNHRPAVALAARDLGVHEEILHFLRAAREPVARAAGANDETFAVRAEPPWPPTHRAFEAQLVVFPDGTKPSTQISLSRAGVGGEQLHQRRLEPPRETWALLPEGVQACPASADRAPRAAAGCANGAARACCRRSSRPRRRRARAPRSRRASPPARRSAAAARRRRRAPGRIPRVEPLASSRSSTVSTWSEAVWPVARSP